jgi:hypothetical protein
MKKLTTRKRYIALFLALVMSASMLTAFASAAQVEAIDIEELGIVTSSASHTHTTACYTAVNAKVGCQMLTGSYLGWYCTAGRYHAAGDTTRHYTWEIWQVLSCGYPA